MGKKVLNQLHNTVERKRGEEFGGEDPGRTSEGIGQQIFTLDSNGCQPGGSTFTTHIYFI